MGQRWKGCLSGFRKQTRVVPVPRVVVRVLLDHGNPLLKSCNVIKTFFCRMFALGLAFACFGLRSHERL